MKIVFIIANSVDTDEMPHDAAFRSGSSLLRVTCIERIIPLNMLNCSCKNRCCRFLSGAKMHNDQKGLRPIFVV